MRVLLTNDDGIHSVALQRLARALIEKKWEVYVSAPAMEQSGVGRACGLTRGISIVPFEELECTAWAVNGTPLDCVNLALSHWLEKQRPDIVISGINWGVNISVPMIFSSGTIGGAIEGAAFGIPSIAVSQCLPDQDKQYIQKKIDFLAHEGLMKSIDEAIKKTVQYAEYIAKTSDNVVHNINFPYPTTSETSEEITMLSNIMHGKNADYPVYCALYEKRGDQYYFAIEQDVSIPPPPGSDIYALLQGKISHSIIDLRRLCF
ncbi:MAG: 5'/3'-nucleotidase SurE [Puniceicoccales bacterium]|jgi:5'-nucleotidase|nr:5'/3'-nucleotidase SurE [Puniceicoccales bacterium]